MKTLILSLLFVTSQVWAVKTYQVTGPVLELSESKIVVQKGHDRWEIDRSAATKTPANLKVGDKVTIEYTMSAANVEVKDSKKKK